MIFDGEIDLLDKEDPTFMAIVKYADDSSDKDLTYTAEVLDVFRITRSNQTSAKHPTTITLMHGSRSKNWKGIMRFALQVAPVTGKFLL